MIKRKHYLETHNVDGTLKSHTDPTPSGNKRKIAELESALAESQGVVKGLEMQLKAGQGDTEQGQSNKDCDALVPYGHTRTPMKKRG